MIQHGYKLDNNQQSEGDDEHEADGLDEQILSGELQVYVDLRHLDEDGRGHQLQGEGGNEPEGVTDEVDEGDLWRRRLEMKLWTFTDIREEFHKHLMKIKTHFVSQLL